ncbi:MAG: hypothetical protein ACI8TQ_003750, partial [Planctomycetota bacterium]
HTDGSITSWGSDAFGQVSNTPTGMLFSEVAAGTNHSLALRNDGSLSSWGADDFGVVTNTPSGNDFIGIAAGGFHSVALRANGTLVTWGDDFGNAVSNTPGGTDFTQVSAGLRHSLALSSSGIVCQPNHGFGGPGSSELSLCGSALATGQSASLELTGAKANALGWLVIGGAELATPFYGGTLLPIPVLKLITINTNTSGAFIVPNVNGGGGPVTAYIQAIYLDPALPGGVGISNAIAANFLL